jgi:hypothetical protein
MHDLGNVEAWRGEKRIRGEPHGSTSLKRWDSKRLYWSVTAPAQPQFKPIYQAQTQLAIHSTFDGSMILFENVVQVLHRSVSTAVAQRLFLLDRRLAASA